MPTAPEDEDLVVMTIRMPRWARDELRRAARRERRSMNQEVLYRLELAAIDAQHEELIPIPPGARFEIEVDDK